MLGKFFVQMFCAVLSVVRCVCHFWFWFSSPVREMFQMFGEMMTMMMMTLQCMGG